MQLVSEIPSNLIRKPNLDLENLQKNTCMKGLSFLLGKEMENKCILSIYYVLDHYKQNRPQKRNQNCPFKCEWLSQNFVSHL